MPAGDRPSRLVLAGIHGEEPETVVLLSRALRLLGERPPIHRRTVSSLTPSSRAA